MDNFDSSHPKPGKITENSLWFIFVEDKILLVEQEDVYSPLAGKHFLELKNDLSEWYYLGNYKGTDCYTGNMNSIPPDEFFEIIRLRKSFYFISEKMFFLAARAYQTLHFHRSNKFCGNCGAQMKFVQEEFLRICSHCSLTVYPQQAPAVIVAVSNKDKILLARAEKFPGNMYSVLAGFVEPGESLEDCIRREVREECGIEVMNIKYFGSQTWPFPNSLMIGFRAEYKSGEIKIDEKEIVDAGWYFYDNLPVVPDNVSIARKLIDDFVKRNITSEDQSV